MAALIRALLIASIVFASSTPASKADFTSCNYTEKFSEREMAGYILKNYSPSYRPRRDMAESVQVGVYLRLYGIQDFNERENLLSINGYLSLAWIDEFLRWNESKFHCADWLDIKATDVWTPNLHINNSPDQGKEFFDQTGLIATVYSSGMVELTPEGHFSVSCQIDLTYFPFDEQVCSIIVESPNYQHERMQLIDGSFLVQESFWAENQMWQIVDNRTRYLDLAYSGTHYDAVFFTLLLRRKPLYYYVNIIMPCIIIEVVTLVVFMLPNGDSCKVETAVTCLLAFTIFQTMVVSDMTRSSIAFPLLILYINLQMIYISLFVIICEGFVLYVLNMAEDPKNRKVPAFIFDLVVALSKLLLMESAFCNFCCHCGGGIKKADAASISSPSSVPVAKKDNDISGLYEDKSAAGHHSHVVIDASKAAFDHNDDSSNNNVNDDSDERRAASAVVGNHYYSREEQWQLTARVVERSGLVLYVGCIVLTPIALYCFVPVRSAL